MPDDAVRDTANYFCHQFGAFRPYCKYCNAGLRNGSKHDPNCPINLPGSVEKFMPAWQDGFNARKANQSCNPPDFAEQHTSHEAYMMGWNLADGIEKKRQSELAFTSVERAIQQVRSL